MRAPTVIAIVVVLAATATAVAAGTGPAIKLSSVGNTNAGQALLKLSDLGKGWKATAAPVGGLQLSCKGFQPSLKGIVETGVATSPALSASSVGPFVSQIVSVYGTTGQVAALWRQAITPGLIACVVQSVEAIAAVGKGLKVKILSKGPLAIAKPTALVTAFRVIADVSAAKVSYVRKLYFDVVVVAKKSTVSEITVSSYQRAVPGSVESALAALVAHRIGLPTA